MFLFQELSSDEVYMQEFLLLLGYVKMEVLTVCHGLVEARSNTVQYDVDQALCSHLGIDINSINIILACLDSICLLEITNLVKSPVWLTVVTTVLLNGILYLFSSIKPMPVRFPPRLHITSSI